MSRKIRVRIAPSPTGNLHIGTARTALFNWLWAKKQDGEFILRIEDTDLERSDPKFEKDIIDGLKWLGLKWDGETYRQSERVKNGVYGKYIKELLDNKKAFWCYHSKEELEQEQKKQMANKEAPRHICEYKNTKHKAQSTKKERGIIRLAVDENSDEKIPFNDIIRGKIEFEKKLMGDISIARDENTPLYNFAVVVDDHETKITHVVRGEDHIPNTPKQILIQQALEFPRPEYAHLPLILGPDRSKMSKRHGATSIVEFQELGYLPEAMVNYMAMLGFTLPDDRQILPLGEIVKIFDLEKVHKAGAVFDIKKLDFINSVYIKKQSDSELLTTLTDFGAKLSNDKNYNLQIMPLVKERMIRLSDIEEFKFFFEEPDYDKELLKWKDINYDEIKNSLEEVKKIVESVGVGAPRKLREKLDKLGEKLTHSTGSGQSRGLVYWPLRVSLSGQKGSPDPVDIAIILGQEKTLERIEGGVRKLKNI